MSEYEFKYDFYLLDHNMRLIYGFTDKKEAEFYSSLIDCHMFCYDKIMSLRIDPSDINNWTDDVPTILECLA